MRWPSLGSYSERGMSTHTLRYLLVKSGGRIVVITFMSLEDRKVKQKFQALGREKRALILTKHVVKPSEGEVSENPASRSSKLRALEMK